LWTDLGIRGDQVTGPTHRAEPRRDLDPRERTPEPTPTVGRSTSPAAVRGLAFPPPRTNDESTAAPQTQPPIRRITFNRSQLADAAKVDDIIAVAPQDGQIDTKSLTPEQRIKLIRVLAVDATFSSKHADLLSEFAEEIKVERAATTGAKPVMYDTAATFDRDPNTFASRQEADSNWRSSKSGFNKRKVIGDYPEATLLSLDYTLFKFTRQSRMRTELRWIVPVRLGPATPDLPVIMSWDDSGTASIRLVSTTGVRAATGRPTIDQLVPYLDRRGVTVANLKSWTAEQLEEFVRAVRLVDKLDPAAIGAIKGLVLEYSTAPPADSPHQEAVFVPETVTTKPTLTIRASTFGADAKKFVGSEKSDLQCRSTMTLAHELGHVVETEVSRRLGHAFQIAEAEQGVAYDAFSEAKTRYLNEGNAAKRAVHKLYGDSAATSVDLANAYAAIYEVAELEFSKAIDALDQVTTNGREPTLRAAVVQNAKAVVAGAATAVNATVKAQQAGVTETIQGKPLVNQLALGYKQLAPLLDKLGKAAQSAREAKAALVPAVYEIPGGKGASYSRRLHNFVEYVKALRPDAQSRVIGITAYAKEQWRAKPGETFAEAYALWLTDAAFLTRVAPEFVTYFAKGMHLK